MSFDGSEYAPSPVHFVLTSIAGSATFIGLGVYLATLPTKNTTSINQANPSGQMIARALTRYSTPIKGCIAAPFILLGLYRLVN